MHAGVGARATGPTYTVHGRAVTLPVEVRDAVVTTATFVVSAVAARRLVPAPILEPAAPVPGRALCVLATVEYRDNDLGIYNELGVNFFVTRGRALPVVGPVIAWWRGSLGAYVHRLPVTTAFSCDAGRDIWGFPKTVEEITFTDTPGWRSCTLVSEGAHVLTLAVARGGRRVFTGMAQDTYASRDGVVWKTPSEMSGTGVGVRMGGASLTLGTHPLADELRALGLPRRALMSTSIERMSARYGVPETL